MKMSTSLICHPPGEMDLVSFMEHPLMVYTIMSLILDSIISKKTFPSNLILIHLCVCDIILLLALPLQNCSDFS